MDIEQSQVPVAERDCAVCLQKCHFPTQLPCGHIFCFLCVKGVARQSKKCAMCRAEIPPDYLDNPVILEKLTPEQTTATQATEEYQWYYEGRNGWWKYDDCSNSELEIAYNEGRTQCKLLLAGALYCIDFQNMVQMQTRDPSKRRRVRRDTPTLPAKGIAGIKMIDDTTQIPIDPAKSESEEGQNDGNTEDVIEVVDSDGDNVEQDEESVETHEHDVSDLTQRISSIDIQEPTVEQRSAIVTPAVEDTSL